MSHRDDSVRLRHMLDYAEEAVKFSAGRNRTELDSDRLFSLAMVRLVEVIGEAAARVSDEVRRRHPQIPWNQIVGARHRLIHGYDQIDGNILWDILTFDLPPLVEQLRQTLVNPPKGDPP